MDTFSTADPPPEFFSICNELVVYVVTPGRFPALIGINQFIKGSLLEPDSYLVNNCNNASLLK